jgi:hypothetical protein
MQAVPISALQTVLFLHHLHPAVPAIRDSIFDFRLSPSVHSEPHSQSKSKAAEPYRCGLQRLRGGAPPRWGDPKTGVWGGRSNHDPRRDPFPDRSGGGRAGAGGAGGMGSAIMRGVTEAVAREQLQAALKERLKEELAGKLKEKVQEEVEPFVLMSK